VDRKGTHYEQAFEAYLKYQRLPYVALDQARQAVLAGAHLKSFDFLIYPPSRRNLLTDIKGRKFSLAAYRRGRLGDSWVTAGDVEGLGCWQDVFGPGYLAVLIFAYWLQSDPVPSLSILYDDTPGIFCFQSRLYTFHAVELNAYRLALKVRSPRWQTVYVPARIFSHLAQPVERYFPDPRRRRNTIGATHQPISCV